MTLKFMFCTWCEKVQNLDSGYHQVKSVAKKKNVGGQFVVKYRTETFSRIQELRKADSTVMMIQ